jgi:hypothetical protein
MSYRDVMQNDRDTVDLYADAIREKVAEKLPEIHERFAAGKDVKKDLFDIVKGLYEKSYNLGKKTGGFIVAELKKKKELPGEVVELKILNVNDAWQLIYTSVRNSLWYYTQEANVSRGIQEVFAGTPGKNKQAEDKIFKEMEKKILNRISNPVQMFWQLGYNTAFEVK